MKKYIRGILCGVIISTSITAFASSGRTITVFDTVKRIVINKVNKPFDSKNKPFTYNGTTYVPLTFIAEALGEKVTWDGKTGTVFIGETDVKQYTSLAKLNHLQEYSQYQWSGNPFKAYNRYKILQWSMNDDKDNVGNKYAEGLLFILQGSGSNGTKQVLAGREYYVNQKYSTISGKFVLHERDKSYINVNAALRIYCDDKRVYESDRITTGSLPIDFNVDISGAKKIKVEVINTQSPAGTYGLDSSASINVGVVDSTLY